MRGYTPEAFKRLIDWMGLKNNDFCQNSDINEVATGFELKTFHTSASDEIAVHELWRVISVGL